MGEMTKDPLLQKIWFLRKRLKLSQAKMAEKLGIEQASYSAIESGTNRVYADYLPGIAEALGIKVWQLFVDEDGGEIGPLSDEEKALILNFRKIPSESKRQVVKDAAEQFANTQFPVHTP